MTYLAVILLVAAAGFGVSRWLRLPVIPLLLFAGMALGIGDVLTPEPGAFITHVLELGLSFLVFSAGIELNPDRFRRHRKAVFGVGSCHFGLISLVGYWVARMMEYHHATAIYLALALATSSTLVVVNVLKQSQRMFEPFARLVIGVLLLQDLGMILTLVVLSRWSGGPWEVVRGLAGVVAMTGVAAGLQRWVYGAFIRRSKPDEETWLLAMLGLLFAFIGLANALDLPLVVGAFLAGVSLSKFPVNGVARGLLTSLSDFFQALFFTAMGFLVMAPTASMIGHALVFALVVLLLTPPLVTYLAEKAGLNSRAALESGLLLAQTSEFALVLGLSGSVLGQIDRKTLSIIALVSVITMTLTPFVATERVNRFLLRFHPSRRQTRENETHFGHILVLGFGAGGMWVVKPLLQEGSKVLVVDDDPVVIEQLRRAEIPCLRGDGADEKVLAKSGAQAARLILVAMRRASEAETVLRFVRGHVPVMVRVFEEDEARFISQRGGIPILNAAAATDTFMDWFDKTMVKAGPAERVAKPMD